VSQLPEVRQCAGHPDDLLGARLRLRHRVRLATVAAGSADPAVRGVNGVTKDGTKCSLYAECEAAAAGGDIDYDGPVVLDFVGR
jgi:hypothetical protein